MCPFLLLLYNLFSLSVAFSFCYLMIFDCIFSVKWLCFNWLKEANPIKDFANTRGDQFICGICCAMAMFKRSFFIDNFLFSMYFHLRNDFCHDTVDCVSSHVCIELGLSLQARGRVDFVAGVWWRVNLFDDFVGLVVILKLWSNHQNHSQTDEITSLSEYPATEKKLIISICHTQIIFTWSIFAWNWLIILLCVELQLNICVCVCVRHLKKI